VLFLWGAAACGAQDADVARCGMMVVVMGAAGSVKPAQVVGLSVGGLLRMEREHLLSTLTNSSRENAAA